MNKNSQIWLGIFVLLAIIVSLWFWFRNSVPKPSEIEAATKVIKPVDENILKEKTTQEILKMEVYGSVPVEVSEGEKGRDNPFSNY